MNSTSKTTNTPKNKGVTMNKHENKGVTMNKNDNKGAAMSTTVNNVETMDEHRNLNSLVEGQLIFAVLESVEANEGKFVTGSGEHFTLAECEWPFSVKQPGDGGWLITYKENNFISKFRKIKKGDSYITSENELKDKNVSVIYGVVAGVNHNSRIAYVYYAPGKYVTVKYPSTLSKFYTAGTLSQTSVCFNEWSAIRAYPLYIQNTELIYDFFRFTPIVKNKYASVFHNQKNYFPSQLDSDKFVDFQCILNQIRDWVSVSDSEICKTVKKDYAKALENDRIIVESLKYKKYSFQTSLCKKCEVGEVPILINFSAGKRGDDSRFYFKFAGLRASGIEKALKCDMYVHDWGQMYKKLTKISIEENWGGGKNILRSFFAYNYYAATFMNKISTATRNKSEYSIFDTGLVDDWARPIYCFLENFSDEYRDMHPLLKKYKYKFVDFVVMGSRDNTKLEEDIQSLFSQLPKKVNFPEKFNFADHVYTSDKDIFLDYSHIISDNICRFPKKFIEEHCSDDQEFMRLYQDGKKNEFSDVKRYLKEHRKLFQKLVKVLDDCRELIKRRWAANYKTAIPIYHPAEGKICYVLPLALNPNCREKAKSADIALVVAKQPSGNYCGTTILSLENAYKDSRLICSDTTWLKPPNSAAANEI